MTDKPYIKKGAVEVNLGRIESETTFLDSGAQSITIPLQESDKTKAIDFMGKLKRITLKGNLVGTLSELVTLTQQIDNMIDAGQNESTDQVTYYGQTGTVYAAGVNVLLKSINYTFVAGIVTKVEYTIELFVSELIVSFATEEPKDEDIS